ncbi:MAG: glycoside hydrolase family 2, partial [Alphaproteobacteria bacterium]|nr:glycoside hydrolase family 2 [Alphaproteobacteria bacterium]
LLGPLDQGYWPESNLTPPSGEALRRDVQWIKDCGFNTVRKHQKVEDPRFMYWADKLGVMVWGEMANAQSATPRGQQRTLNEMKRAIERDYNHPCIITWVPENESFSGPGLKHGIKQQYTFQQELIEEMHTLDPTRPALPDGWLHNPEADIIGIHDYAATGDELRQHYIDFETGRSLEGNAGTSPYKIMALESLYRQQPIILTEVGGFMYNSPEESGMGYATINGTEDYLNKYEEIAQAIMDSTPISGAIFTQAYHVETEKNGFQTYDRQPLVPPEKIKAINDRIFSKENIRRDLKLRKHQMLVAAKVLREKALLVSSLRASNPYPTVQAGLNPQALDTDLMDILLPCTIKDHHALDEVLENLKNTRNEPPAPGHHHNRHSRASQLGKGGGGDKHSGIKRHSSHL